MMQMTYADGQLMMKSIVLIHVILYIVAYLHISSATLAEHSSFSKTGLAMPNFKIK